MRPNKQIRKAIGKIYVAKDDHAVFVANEQIHAHMKGVTLKQAGTIGRMCGLARLANRKNREE